MTLRQAIGALLLLSLLLLILLVPVYLPIGKLVVKVLGEGVDVIPTGSAGRGLIARGAHGKNPTIPNLSDV